MDDQTTLLQNIPLALVGLLIVFAVQLIIAAAISMIRQLDEKWRYQEKRDNAERSTPPRWCSSPPPPPR